MAGKVQESWTIQRLLEWTSGYLAKHNDPRPRLSAEWLICGVLNLTRVELYTHFDQPLTSSELNQMHEAVVRRAKGEPLQYLTGEMGFRHLIMTCAPEVLIPRPETETLVDLALLGVDAASAAGHTPTVLEIGVGSGCISCSLAFERPLVQVVGTDISPAAIALAQKNAAKYNLDPQIKVVKTSYADALDPQLKGTFDVLVSNPPYIPTAVIDTLPQEVRAHEPHLALDGGGDGLDVFRGILTHALDFVRPRGLLCVELFEDNVNSAAELCRADSRFAEVRVESDLNHRPRFLVARLQGDLTSPLAQAHEQVKNTQLKIKEIDQNDSQKQQVAYGARLLKNNAVIIVPTDSVYGIGCAALPQNPALKRTFDIKERAYTQTLPLLMSDPSQLEILGTHLQPYAYALAQAFWPGALTLVVKADPTLAPEYVEQSTQTVALRVPNSNFARALIREVGAPLALTSANKHGEPSATSAQSLNPNLISSVDVVFDAGKAPLAQASTIVDCTGVSPLILREGALAISDIMDVVKTVL